MRGLGDGGIDRQRKVSERKLGVAVGNEECYVLCGYIINQHMLVEVVG